MDSTTTSQAQALAIRGASEYNGCVVTLWYYLDSLLPDTPANILVLGWPIDEDISPGRHKNLQRITSPNDDVDLQSYDIVVWYDRSADTANADANIEAVGKDISTSVALVQGWLRDSGQLIFVARQPAKEQQATRQRGALPTRHQVRLREMVRCLSEAGFAIRKDEDRAIPKDEDRAIPKDEDRAIPKDEDRAIPKDEDREDFKILVARPDPLRIRSVREGDEDAILRLFRDCFQVNRGLDHWRWKYAENPYGQGRASLGLTPEGSLAAHYGGYPISIWRRGERGQGSFLALQVGDTMTDPRFRHAGRGKSSLLARTVRHFFSIHRDGSLGFYFGFNTGPIQRFCRWFIGGSQTLPVHYRTRPIEPEHPLSTSGYRIERIERTGAAWNSLFKRVAGNYRFLVQRDARYVDWRYLKCPDTRYVVLAAFRWGRLVGWSVFNRRDERILWGDALFAPRHARAAAPILATAMNQPEFTGAKQIAGWFPNRPTWWSQELEALGFSDQPEPEGLGMVALPDAEPDAFAAINEMYYTMGDGDLF